MIRSSKPSTAKLQNISLANIMLVGTLWTMMKIKVMTANSFSQMFWLLQLTICVWFSAKTRKKSCQFSWNLKKKEARASSIFLFSTGFNIWAQGDKCDSDEISIKMDTSSDDDGSYADPLLSYSRDEWWVMSPTWQMLPSVNPSQPLTLAKLTRSAT